MHFLEPSTPYIFMLIIFIFLMDYINVCTMWVLLIFFPGSLVDPDIYIPILIIGLLSVIATFFVAFVLRENRLKNSQAPIEHWEEYPEQSFPLPPVIHDNDEDI